MTSEGFIALRKSLGLTQSQMGEHLGLSLRAVQDLEGGASKLKSIHVAAAERVALTIAVERRNPMLAPASIRSQALDLAEIIRNG